MDFNDYLTEFADDWRLAGRSPATCEEYCRLLRQLWNHSEHTVTLRTVKSWIADSGSPASARWRGRAVRAFATWAATNDGPDWNWWKQVPLTSERVTPQPTVSADDYETFRDRATSQRNRLVIELLWCTGLRVSELARLACTDVDLAGGYAVVRQSKTGRPRLVPLSDRACRLIRRQTNGDGSLLGMSAHAIQLMLRRLGAPSAHAWRRGWAVHALRSGVSQTSVQAAAGWSSGAMVTRYTAAVSGELAISEFRRRHKPTAPDYPLT